MLRNVYVVYDKLAEKWNEPMLAYNDDNDENDKAIQVSVLREMRNKNSYAYQNADDLDLYHIGTYDDNTGSYSMLEPKRLVFHYSSLKGE